MSSTSWFLFHLLLGAVGAWIVRGYARRRALFDQPGERRSHAVPTPRGGGAAIAAALLVATAWLAWRMPGYGPLLAGFGVGLALVSLVGWIDDHRPLPAWTRLGVHVVAGAVFALGSWIQSGDGLAALVAFGATVALVNVWNFMDGIDGLASTQAILVALVLAMLAGPVGSALGIALVAATFGFLPWNFPRARLFLGDVGSGTLGFAIGGLVAMATAADPRALVLSLLPLSGFLVDTGLTLCRRMLNGERWWQAHVSHAFQHAARRHGHVPVTLAFAAWTAAMVAMAWMFRDMAVTPLTIALLLSYASGSVAWWLLRRSDGLPAMENKE
ncbi:MAG TPA: lipopolysaccharide biosynthesis protein [Xanthomonadaceae bacterium]|nr:lipopolysaccharide biosynthesis protein [Xanthomonadaceae bacterium]